MKMKRVIWKMMLQVQVMVVVTLGIETLCTRQLGEWGLVAGKKGFGSRGVLHNCIHSGGGGGLCERGRGGGGEFHNRGILHRFRRLGLFRGFVSRYTCKVSGL